MEPRDPKDRLTWLPGPGLFLFWTLTRTILLLGLSRLGDAGDGVMPLVFSWVEKILSGESPYSARGVAYPPLAMYFFTVIGLGEDDPGGYTQRFVAVLLVLDFAGLCVAVAAEKRGRRYATPAYILGLLCVGPILLLWRYDLIPALCHLAAGLWLFRGFRRSSWAALGVGIAAKPYLLVVLPFWVVWELKSLLPLPRRRVSEGLVFALVPSLVAAVAMIPLSGSEFVSSYIFQASRGLQVESGPAVILAELARAGISSQQPIFSEACLCWERTGSAAALVSASFTALAMAGIGMLLLLVWRTEKTQAVLSEKVMLASCAALVITLVTFRVFSPQYMVWALAPLSLVAGTRGGAAATMLVASAALAATYLYPLHYGEVINYTGAGRWLSVARLAALAAAFLSLLPLKAPRAVFRS